MPSCPKLIWDTRLQFEDDRFWIDGEWIALLDEDTFSSEAERLEYDAQLKWDFPRASDVNLVPYYLELLDLAERYFRDTKRHLNIYGDIGELYGAIEYGIRLNRPLSQGADGRLGNHHVEIKTISPLSGSDCKELRRSGNWSKILLVKIDNQFDVRGYMLDRNDFPGKGQKVRIKWDSGLSTARRAS